MVWKVEFAQNSEQDLSLIFDHLYSTYQELGEPENEAFNHAAERVMGIRDNAQTLATNPYCGTLREAFGPNVRNVTLNKAAIWSQVDEDNKIVRVLAFFFGGRDHMRHMLRQLLEK